MDWRSELEIVINCLVSTGFRALASLFCAWCRGIPRASRVLVVQQCGPTAGLEWNAPPHHFFVHSKAKYFYIYFLSHNIFGVPLDINLTRALQSLPICEGSLHCYTDRYYPAIGLHESVIQNQYSWSQRVWQGTGKTSGTETGNLCESTEEGRHCDRADQHDFIFECEHFCWFRFQTQADCIDLNGSTRDRLTETKRSSDNAVTASMTLCWINGG